MSYWDLVERYGEQEAARRFAMHGRRAFLPLSFMGRVLRILKPAMVVTTNAPRSERAAIIVAKQHGIPTLSMVDLFGIHQPVRLDADVVTVLSQWVIDNLRRERLVGPDVEFMVTGNPAFDQALDACGPPDPTWRKQHFPSLAADGRVVLWADTTGYWLKRRRVIHRRSSDQITDDLELLSGAAKANDAILLIRPHPSQSVEVYRAWLAKTQYPHVALAGDVPLHPLLRSVDAVVTYDSTVGIEALLMRRSVIQLQKKPRCDIRAMPLAEWGIARLADGPAALPRILQETLLDEHTSSRMLDLARTLLPQDKAAPVIASYIHRLLLGRS